MQPALKEIQQDKFLHFLSHDLREPARLVSQFLKLVKDRNENLMDKKSEEFLNYAISASQKMDRMIQAVFNLSRISTDEEHKADLDVIKLLEDINDELEDEIRAKNASIVFQGESVIHVRKGAFKKILKELVTNSLIHAQTKSPLKIEVITQTKEECVVLKVIDNGAPLAVHLQEKIFEPFQKMNSDSVRMGTGLTKCRMLVENYDGKITMKISDLGKTMLLCELN